MLTKVTVYSSLPGLDPLVFRLSDIPDSDLFEVRNIDGLGAVKADVNTSPFAIIRGESYIGSGVGKRNLVFTIGLRPDWDTWTPTKLRRLLDLYFMPQLNPTLIFEGDEQAPVVISGYVESNDPNIFNKDSENQVSIVCPEPDFVTVDPVVVEGSTSDDTLALNYRGTVDTGFHVAVAQTSGSDPSDIGVHAGDKHLEVATTTGLLNSSKTFAMSSVTKQKFVRNIDTSSGAITNLLNHLVNGSTWPVFKPGVQNFYVSVNAGASDWTLTYFERFGSL